MANPVRITLLTLLLTFTGCTSIERLAIPEAEAITADWPRAAEQEVDHGAWDAFLARYARTDAKGVTRVDYGAVTAADRRALEGYISDLEATGTGGEARNAQLSYWINLYNAKTVAVILDHYPVRSIRRIRAHPLDPGPWDEARLTVAGRRLSLHDIEHGIVRPGWADVPEVHYLLNCAAAGCPNLGLSAYTGANIDSALETAARAFVNDPRGVTVLPNGGLRLSKIYAWYREDFGSGREDLLEHLRRYAAPPLLEKLDEDVRIRGYAYDWSLNDTANAAQ